MCVYYAGLSLFIFKAGLSLLGLCIFTRITLHLPVVCTLKGVCQDSWYKGSNQCIVYCVCYVVCQHCQHKDQSMQCIECYVCWHCQHWCLWLYTGVKTLLYSVYSGLLPLQEEGLYSLSSCRLAVHQSEKAVLLTFWDLSNYKGDCRQDAQPTTYS